MIPTTLKQKLSCPLHRDIPLNLQGEYLLSNCGKQFSTINDIPSILLCDPEALDWNPWSLDKVEMSGNTYYQRSIGLLPEKEASKSFAEFMKVNDFFHPNDSILDYGCATGHFYKSFKRILDNPQYTGFDSHHKFLQYGGEAFGISDQCNFIRCDAYNIPVLPNSFDISVVNLWHFFPEIYRTIREGLRVTKNYIIWRTPISEKQNYTIKLMHNEHTPLHLEEPTEHDIYLILTKEYIKKVVSALNGKVEMIVRDTNFEPFDNTLLSDFENIPATKVVNGMQINGSLILDWHYVVITK